jgi:hypothetical protein
MRSLPRCRWCFALAALARAAGAQAFVHDTASIPQGPVFNGGTTENVELFDADLDGDPDCFWANGGAAGNEQNRTWLNQGGLQGGTTGVFADATAARLPPVLDSSRDLDFVDLEGDGDLDLFVSNSSGVANQTNRWWVDAGGAQGGTAGFFVDETAARWVGIGVNDGSSQCSSVAPSLVLAGGGFIDWSCDSAAADLDGDGDLDLVQASYGALSSGRVPTRMFLNDGAGRFREFNPSCFQLAGSDIHNGDPALWAQGLHHQNTYVFSGARADVANDAIAIELGDLDGDLDLDLLHGEKFRPPRVFTNRLTGGELLAFRDVTQGVVPGQSWAPGSGNYEQELGDLDGDLDLDVYGVNWSSGDDSTISNHGDGTFAAPYVIPLSVTRHNEADWFDHDHDGDLDVFVASESTAEKIYENPGAPGGHALALNAALLPFVAAAAEGADAEDVDLDGDDDLLVATLFFQPNLYLRNTTQTPDVHAPLVARLEQAPDRAWSPLPTPVRVQVYDNAPWYRTARSRVELEYLVGTGAVVAVPMRWSGGQVFRGEIPGTLQGLVLYRAVARDDAGNAGSSAWSSYDSAACNGEVAVYCTAKPNSLGCLPSIQGTGTPSASLPQPFRIKATQVLSNKAGLLFYGFDADERPFQGGWLCVRAPPRRTALQASGGNPPPDDCSGAFSFDFNHHIRHGGDPGLVPGAWVGAQYWYRDPGALGTSGLSDALAFFVCP